MQFSFFKNIEKSERPEQRGDMWPRTAAFWTIWGALVAQVRNSVHMALKWKWADRNLNKKLGSTFRKIKFDFWDVKEIKSAGPGDGRSEDPRLMLMLFGRTSLLDRLSLRLFHPGSCQILLFGLYFSSMLALILWCKVCSWHNNSLICKMWKIFHHLVERLQDWTLWAPPHFQMLESV